MELLSIHCLESPQHSTSLIHPPNFIHLTHKPRQFSVISPLSSTPWSNTFEIGISKDIWCHRGSRNLSPKPPLLLLLHHHHHHHHHHHFLALAFTSTRHVKRQITYSSHFTAIKLSKLLSWAVVHRTLIESSRLPTVRLSFLSR